MPLIGGFELQFDWLGRLSRLGTKRSSDSRARAKLGIIPAHAPRSTVDVPACAKPTVAAVSDRRMNSIRQAMRLPYNSCMPVGAINRCPLSGRRSACHLINASVRDRRYREITNPAAEGFAFAPGFARSSVMARLRESLCLGRRCIRGQESNRD